MAKAAAAPVPAAAGDAPPKKKGKLIIIIAVILVLALGGGGAAWFLLVKKHADEEQGDEHAEEAPKPKPKKKAEPGAPPVFVNLEPFVVNLRPEGNGDQFLQVVAVLKVEDQHEAENVKLYMPEIRHHILLLLSAKKASEVGAPESREELAEDLKDAVNGVVGEPPPKSKKKPQVPTGPIKSVFFTSFIVQ
ncbi:MAG: flagellar basal body-associated FliL family protein [Rhodocyclaceae bacterium]|nr:flagellar basal body-associated FliL family protein [Rhodocyclaceae bacterium]MBX3668644.1 flagellar basal body-associated FliL family protein [Rhodocyclaceae bacterium]